MLTAPPSSLWYSKMYPDPQQTEETQVSLSVAPGDTAWFGRQFHAGVVVHTTSEVRLLTSSSFVPGADVISFAQLLVLT